ncbi:uncharacterized protein [Littorina saxatilis]|uniref:Uncharacterized protein n=1 Tax=Littorina saxatilis TaxID=31220 RepID=A0AAN9GKM3_9CAEN
MTETFIQPSRLSFIAKLTYAHHMLDMFWASQPLNHSNPADLESEEVLNFLLLRNRERMSSGLITCLAPASLRQLSLQDCCHLVTEDVLHILSKCSALNTLSLKNCDGLDIATIVTFAQSALTSLVTLNLSSCTVTDEDVQGLVRTAPLLRHLMLADTLVGDTAFLEDLASQAQREMALQTWEMTGKFAAQLVTVDVSRCRGFTSEGLLHLCSLCGPSLRSVNLQHTQVDFEGLLYLCGHSRVSASQYLHSKGCVSRSPNRSSQDGSCKSSLTGQANDVTDQADDVTGQSQDVMGQADDVTGQANDVTAQANEVTGQADDVTGQANDVTVQADDVTGRADDVTGQADDVTGLADDVTGQADDVMGQADVTGQVDDVTEPSNATAFSPVWGDPGCFGNHNHGDSRDVDHQPEFAPASTNVPLVDTVLTRGENRHTHHPSEVIGVEQVEVHFKLAEQTAENICEECIICRKCDENCNQASDSEDVHATYGPSLQQLGDHACAECVTGMRSDGGRSVDRREMSDAVCRGSATTGDDADQQRAECKSHGHSVKSTSGQQSRTLCEAADFTAVSVSGQLPSSVTAGMTLHSPLSVTTMTSSVLVTSLASVTSPRAHEPLLTTSTLQGTHPHSLTEASLTKVSLTSQKSSVQSLAESAVTLPCPKMFKSNLKALAFSADVKLQYLRNRQLPLTCFEACLRDNLDLCELKLWLGPRPYGWHDDMASENAECGRVYMDSVVSKWCEEFYCEMVSALGRLSPCVQHLAVNQEEAAGSYLTDDCVVRLLDKCTGLVSLDFAGCFALTDDAFQPLQKNDTLRALNLSPAAVTLTAPFFTHFPPFSQLTAWDLSWCEELDEDCLNRALACCPSLLSLSLRCGPVTNHTLGVLARHCPAIQRLDISGVSELEDDGIVLLSAALRNLTVLDISRNSRLSDRSVQALLTCCGNMESLNLSCIPCITCTPFLSIIVGDRWDNLQTAFQSHKKQKGGERDRELNADQSSPPGGQGNMWRAQRSASYGRCLRSVDLSYCSLVDEEAMRVVVTVCRSGLDVVNYYQQKVLPYDVTL